MMYRKKKKGRKRLPSLKELRKKAWDLQSVWVRSHGADFSGYVACYTCYRVYHWKIMDAGHFIHSSYDFDIHNIKPQCTYCNRYCHGRPLEFYLHLTQEYGTENAEKLRTRPKWNAYKRSQILDVIKKYK